jgi:hypothetical protein
MNDPPLRKWPATALPIQARPVNRTEWTGPCAQRADNSMEAAASRCADLTGIAQQMCYAAEYGITT